MTDTIEAKINAMACYRSEKKEYPHPRSAEGLCALGRLRGTNVGVGNAEAFELLMEKI